MTGPANNPQFSDNPHRGIASLNFRGKTLRFRTNPNEVWWSYRLNTAVEQTYGGRVVQILSASIDDLVFKIDCGRGGWPYLMSVVEFLKQMMIDQRKDGGQTATFEYTTRQWRMEVYALSVPFQDTVSATTRELELRFKVQEDISGVQTSLAMSSELSRLQNGIGWKKGKYNTPSGGLDQHESPGWFSLGDTANNLAGAANNLLGSIPGAGNIPSIGTGALGGLIPGFT
jgi:hypothetical protein